MRITINDYSKRTVDEISDLITFGLKRDIEQEIVRLTLYNVHPQHGPRAAGAGARPLTDKQLLYFATLTHPMKCTWYDEVLYDEEILTYLASAEREKLTTGTDTVQFQAD